MHLNIYLPLLVPLLAGPAAGRIADRLHPRAATWLLSAAAVALALCSTAALGALTLVGLAQLPSVARWGDWSATVLRRDDPTSWLVTAVACLLLGAVVLAFGTAAWRWGGGLLQAYRQSRAWPGTDTLVVLPDPTPDAFTVPGRPGRIVVSTGMLDALDDNEREILLAHERTHLRHRHHLFVAITRLAAAANPLLRPLRTAVAYTVERWADESAAGSVGDRRATAVAVGKAALVRARVRAGGVAWTPVLGFGGTGGPGPVPRRVAALLAGPPGRHVLLVLAAVALLVATGLGTLDALTDAHALLELAEVR